jgi:hypothetical protein
MRWGVVEYGLRSDISFFTTVIHAKKPVNLYTMSYPLNSLGKAIFPGIYAILPAVGVKGASALNYFHSAVSAPHIFINSTLYKRDTVLYHPVTGFVSQICYPITKILNQ